MEIVCCVCDKRFSKNANLRVHLKNVHNINDKAEISAMAPATQSNRNSVECVVCKAMVGTQFGDLKTHFATHNVLLKQEELIFPDMDSFNQWKSELEKKECAQYFKSRTANLKSCSKTYYRCSRAGSYRPKGTGARNTKIQGSKKINGQCPSTITLINYNSFFKCCFVPTHVGHSMDLEHTNLSKECRLEIAKSLAQNIPVGNILDSFRDNFSSEEISRDTLLTKRDIRNVRLAFNINNDGIRHPNDVLSVNSFVLQDRECEVPCVLFYKSVGEDSDLYPSLHKDDFVLIIMNSGQSELLKMYGSDVVCMDSTHGLRNKYMMTTILVLDDLRQGFPCAFMVSSKTDTETMTVFVTEVFKNVGSVNAKVFMSDMDQTLFKAWERVMGYVHTQVYCTWHVLRAWDRNVRRKVASLEDQKRCISELRAMMSETDLQAFNRMLNSFLERVDDNCQSFRDYFSEQYVPIKEKWAHCFRCHIGINTNMHLESLHESLKYYYLNGLKNHRLDKTIHLLMRFLRDRFYDRLITLHKGKITKKLSDLRQRHKTSLTIRDRIVVEEQEHSWQVPASDVTNGVYLVETAREHCTCSLRCEHCEACIHKYTCECRDSSIKWNMCKHIHLVCQYLKQNSLAPAESVGEELVIREESRATERVAVTNGIRAIDGEVDKSVATVKEKVMKKLAEFAQKSNDLRQLQALDKILAPSFPVLNALDQENDAGSSSQHLPWNQPLQRQRSYKKRKLQLTSGEVAMARNNLLFQNFESEDD